MKNVVAFLVALLVASGFVLLGCSPRAQEQSAAPDMPASLEALARHYAPVIIQAAASDQDFITAVNFDGDWVGSNNWENQPAGDLSAHVYFSVIETETHWYLFYSLFHPRDYTYDPCAESNGCHENDLESLELVVAKDGSLYGHPIALLTLAHSHIYLYPVDQTVKAGALKMAGRARLEGEHPVVWVQAFGHGIYGTPGIMWPARLLYRVRDRVVYRVGEQAEVPAGIPDEDARYQLVSIYETLWQHRTEMGPGRLFDQPFNYHGHVLPATLDGGNWQPDKANTPWGYNQEIGETLLRGDFFLDPAKAFSYFATVEGYLSQRYLFNPYLADLQ
ncbi:MAG: hypothetical protein D6791_11230 [Chloroflexi bacterium]|nr:MAG: hypothetical protein D6791_11230 [Chloroflexota bacterium]